MQRAKDRSTDQALLEPPVRSSEHQGLRLPYSNSYGKVRVIKPYSPISWFAVLNTSFMDPRMGQRVFRCTPNTPVVPTGGAEADDCPTLKTNILNGRT